jgi:hypothetical protein
MVYYEFQKDIVHYAYGSASIKDIKAICKKYGVRYIVDKKKLGVNLSNRMVDISNAIHDIKYILRSKARIEEAGYVHYLREICQFLYISNKGTYDTVLTRIRDELKRYTKRDLLPANTTHFII